MVHFLIIVCFAISIYTTVDTYLHFKEINYLHEGIDKIQYWKDNWGLVFIALILIATLWSATLGIIIYGV